MENESNLNQRINEPTTKFTEHVICYMDVLGFKNIINDATGKPIEEEKIINRYAEHSNIIANLNETRLNKHGYKINSTIISDSIILTCEIDLVKKSDAIKRFLTVIQAAAEFQCRLAAEGFFLRGAVSIGKIFVREHLILGPGLIHTYLLEDKYAKYPRIILDNKIFSLLSNPKQLAIEDENFKDAQRIGPRFTHRESFELFYNSTFFDDLFFVDFFNSYLTNATMLDQISEAVRHINLGVLETPDISEKHWWLHRYFKEKIETCLAGKLSKDESIEKQKAGLKKISSELGYVEPKGPDGGRTLHL